MIRNTLLALVGTLFLSTAVADTPAEGAENWVSYGADISAEDAPITAKTFLADPGAHANKTVVVEGKVADVCQKKGCWMVLGDEAKSIRVTFKDYKFFVAMDSKGQTCRLQGVVEEKTVNPEHVKHYQGESTNKDLVPEKAAKDGKTFEFVASGVQILRPTAD